MNDEAVRRQLRFSLFLQAFGAVMMLAAGIVRLAVFGVDVLGLVLVGLGVLIVVAAVLTFRRLRSLSTG